MIFAKKTLFYFVVLNAVLIFAKTIDDYPLTTSCYIQHLHEKGKLNKTLPATVQAPPRCRLIVPYFQNNFMDRVAYPFIQKGADCLAKMAVKVEAYDYLLKLKLCNSLFGDAERQTQYEETERHVVDLEAEIRAKCGQPYDLYRNFTLEDHQREYCIKTYVLDNQLLELSDIENGINPEHIDTQSVNCTNIIAAERCKTETQFKQKMSANDCVMNEFRSSAMFDWKVAMTIDREVYIPGEIDGIDKKIEEFLGLPMQCV